MGQVQLSLSALPTDRVVRLDGPTVEQFAIATDPLPDDAPVIVTLQVQPTGDSANVVDALLDAMETVARAQRRAWLPSADAITGCSDLDRRTIRRLAHEKASVSVHFGPYLADVAEASLTGRVVAAHHDPRTRATGLADILCSSYDRTAVVLALWAPTPLDPGARRALGDAAHWLAGRIGVWVLGDGVVEPDRFPVLTLTVPADLERWAPRAEHPGLDFPVLAGRPHPGSQVEVDFEAALVRWRWARGRAWNHVYQPHPLTPPIRVDVMWPAERVVVELDGPDHRGVLKYADDRRRDNALTAGGYAVLRFTNDEVRGDLSRVLAMIEGLLMARRHDEGISGEDRAR